MGKSQRDKGAGGEREVAQIIRAFGGFMARRGQVFNGEPDIVCPELPIHFEVKRCEKIELHAWWKQACEACGDKYPAVVYRQSYHPWTIVMRARDFLALTCGDPITETPFQISMKFDEFMILLKEVMGDEEK